MPQLTASDVAHVAKLSRLHLTEVELQRYAHELSLIFDYMETLENVDTHNTAETCQVTGLEDRAREDEVTLGDSATRDKLLAAFPERSGDLLRVKAVFDAE